MELKDIKITERFKGTPPNADKMREKILYFQKYQDYEQDIVINKDNELVDGYTTYLLAQIYDKEPKIRRI